MLPAHLFLIVRFVTSEQIAFASGKQERLRRLIRRIDALKLPNYPDHPCVTAHV